MEAAPCAPVFKVCPGCHTEKFISDFHSKGDRHEAICKLCSNARKKKRRLERKKRERRKKAKNHTLVLDAVEIVGSLDSETIENFGQAYGNLIQEVLNADE